MNMNTFFNSKRGIKDIYILSETIMNFAPAG